MRARPHDRHDRHRERQVTVLQPSGAAHALAATRARGRSTCTRPRRSRRTRRARLRELRTAGPPARDLRRRHAPARARGDPQARQPRAHQSRHAPCRDPAPPRSWGDFLANLALVVVDEAHVYRGVFGSHVANVLRRLRRLASAYGTDPRFVLTVGHDRQPGRARPGADRTRLRARRPRRRPARRARDRDVQPAAARRAHRAGAPPASARRPRCLPTSSRPTCGRSASRAPARAAELIYRFANDRLDDAGARAAGSPRTARATRPSSGARSSAGSRRRAARRRRNQRARARHRHRPPGRGDLA